MLFEMVTMLLNAKRHPASYTPYENEKEDLSIIIFVWFESDNTNIFLITYNTTQMFLNLIESGLLYC